MKRILMCTLTLLSYRNFAKLSASPLSSPLSAAALNDTPRLRYLEFLTKLIVVNVRRAWPNNGCYVATNPARDFTDFLCK